MFFPAKSSLSSFSVSPFAATATTTTHNLNPNHHQPP